jgi:hypothetical protein
VTSSAWNGVDDCLGENGVFPLRVERPPRHQVHRPAEIRSRSPEKSLMTHPRCAPSRSTHIRSTSLPGPDRPATTDPNTASSAIPWRSHTDPSAATSMPSKADMPATEMPCLRPACTDREDGDAMSQWINGQERPASHVILGHLQRRQELVADIGRQHGLSTELDHAGSRYPPRRGGCRSLGPAFD